MKTISSYLELQSTHRSGFCEVLRRVKCLIFSLNYVTGLVPKFVGEGCRKYIGPCGNDSRKSRHIVLLIEHRKFRHCTSADGVIRSIGAGRLDILGRALKVCVSSLNVFRFRGLRSVSLKLPSILATMLGTRPLFVTTIFGSAAASDAFLAFVALMMEPNSTLPDNISVLFLARLLFSNSAALLAGVRLLCSLSLMANFSSLASGGGNSLERDLGKSGDLLLAGTAGMAGVIFGGSTTGSGGPTDLVLSRTGISCFSALLLAFLLSGFAGASSNANLPLGRAGASLCGSTTGVSPLLLLLALLRSSCTSCVFVL